MSKNEYIDMCGKSMHFREYNCQHKIQCTVAMYDGAITGINGIPSFGKKL